MFGCMETPEAFRQRVRREQQLIARLRLATTRLADADRERIWAIVAAKEAGLSIRQIARATGLSPTRVHQLLQADEAREISVWLSQLHDDGRSPHAADPEADPPLGSTPSRHAWQRRWKSSAHASRGWNGVRAV
jgi:IclR helix-turn-helix domain